MDQVNKEHNFAAIVRTCDAVGISEAHCVPPQRSRFSVSNFTAGGSGRWVDVHTHDSSEAAIEHLKGRGFRIVAAHPGPEAVSMHEVDFTGKVAVMVGAELDGVSAEGRALADQIMVIPMAGMVASLNVSVATAVILYEAMRQRAEGGGSAARGLTPARREELAFEWSYPRVAELCRRRGVPYPVLDEDGYLPQGWTPDGGNKPSTDSTG